jgi:hypothetical protein
VVITYTYDPLHRLTNAQYSSGACFSYNYDPVGNSVRGRQSHRTDGNDHLDASYDLHLRCRQPAVVHWRSVLHLGQHWQLDQRWHFRVCLRSSEPNDQHHVEWRQFAYNGDGARLQQIIAGVPTTYTQDLAAPLPVVLQAKTGSATTQYVYALGTRPLAQYSTAWEYLLLDILGSVCQIADASGDAILTESHESHSVMSFRPCEPLSGV